MSEATTSLTRAATSGYALEKRFSRAQVKTIHGITKRPCKFDKYKRGEHTPSPALVDAIEHDLPGTKYYLEHVFWKVVRCPCTDMERLYSRLQTLRPEIVDLLFYPRISDGVCAERRHRSIIEIFKALHQEGDWDALTACFGMIQEATYKGNEHLYFLYTHQTFSVFLRFISAFPFSTVANELYRYLLTHFFDNPHGRHIDEGVRELGLDMYRFVTKARLLIIEDLDLLQKYFFTPASCLYIAENYLSALVVKKIMDNIQARDFLQLIVCQKSEISEKLCAAGKTSTLLPITSRHNGTGH